MEKHCEKKGITRMRSKKKAVQDMMNPVAENIKQTWLATGGLIPTYLAALMLNVSMARINQIWKERNLKKYSQEGGKGDLLSFSDVMKIHEEKRKNYKTLTHKDEENGIIVEVFAYEDTKKSKDELYAQIIDNLRDMIYFIKKEMSNPGKHIKQKDIDDDPDKYMQE